MSAGGNNINVLQWRHSGGESLLSNMAYSNGRLLVQKTGYYYIYSKVTVNAAQECSPILHRILSVTSVYDKPIELMKSKRSVSAPPSLCCGDFVCETSLACSIQPPLPGKSRTSSRGWGESVEQFPGRNLRHAERRWNLCHCGEFTGPSWKHWKPHGSLYDMIPRLSLCSADFTHLINMWIIFFVVF